MTSKKCNDCLLFLDMDSFGSNKSIKGGKNRICKSCSIVRSKRYRKNNAEKVSKANKIRCSRYYSKNKDNMLVKAKVYNINNKEKVRLASKKYYERNQETIRRKRKKYYLDNTEKELERNRLYSNENKGLCNSIKTRYMISKKKACPDWADTDKIDLVYKKSHWLSELTGLKYHVDHVIPLQGKNVCGLHVWENLQLLEVSINCSKKNSFGGI